MLRELQVIKDKPAIASYKAGETTISTGMAVVKNETDKTFEFASAETAADLYFVDKERIPTGVNAARGDISDYDADFTTLVEGDFGKLINYLPGERFATDAYVETGIATGVRLSANTAGKIVKAATTVESKYVCGGFYTDNGHKLVIVEVSDTTGKNES